MKYKEANCTYREMTETIRRLIRPCFICDKKHSPSCKKCPPKRVKDGILALLAFGNAQAKAKKNGFIVRRDPQVDTELNPDEIRDLDSIFED